MAQRISSDQLVCYLSRFLTALLLLCSGAHATDPQLSTATSPDPFQQVVPLLNLNNQTIIDGLAELNAATNAAFSVEFPLGHSISAPAPALRTLNVRLGPATLTQMLDELCNSDKTFKWKRIDNTANVFPRDSENDKSYLFNQTLESMSFVNTPDAQKAVFQTVGQLAGPKQQIAVLGSGISVTFAHSWTASLKHITVREAFDRMAQQLGPTYGWQFGGANDFRVITFHERILPKPPQSRLNGTSFGDLPSLFTDLQSLSTSDQAAEQILNLAQSDSTVKAYAAKYLPPAIEKAPSAGFKAWQNAVVLAGELKIVEAAPALARWVDIADRGTGGTPLTANLEHFPAATALCRIGNPAIPALETILGTGEPVKRNYAIVTLKMIGSPDSLATLRSHLSYETDPVLRGRIESALRGPQPPPPLGAPDEASSNSARPEPRDLQRDLAELDSYLAYRNLDTLERVVEEKSRKWQSEDHKSFILYMSKACTLLSSYDIGDMSRRAFMLGQYAIRALTSGDLALEDEVQFVEFLMFDPPKMEEMDWKRLREQKARLWLSTRRRILESIDPVFDFSDRPFLNVAPPPQAAVPAGISPEAVKDPKLRAEYEAAIARNSAKARRFNKQYWLKRNAPRFCEETERYLVNAYSRPPADSPQLEQLLSEYVEDNTVRSRILKEVAERESQ